MTHSSSVEQNCKNLIALGELLKQQEESDLGYSFITPAFSDTCRKIRALMRDHYQIVQSHELESSLWKQRTKCFTCFHFAGVIQENDNNVIKVNAISYIDKLIVIMHELPEETQLHFDKLCGNFLKSHLVPHTETA